MNTKKKTKRFTQKKVANYDFKWITIIAAALIVVVIAIVAIVSIVSYKNSFVCYVDGKGVRDYEYKMFLNTVVSEMEEEAEAEDEDYDADAFWTDEKKKEAQEQALEDASVWQAKYILALENGCKLTKSEEEEVENNIDSYIYYYYSMYSSYGIDLSSVYSMLGIEDLDQTYEFQKKQKVISKYTEKLIDAMGTDELYYTDADDNKTTGEDAILAKYNDNIATYRKVELTSFVVTKATADVEEPTVVEDPGDAPEGVEETSEEYLEWESEKEAYETYLANVEKYEEALVAAVAENAEMREKVTAIYEALAKDGKYTGEGITEYSTSDDEESTETAPKSYTDATIGDLAKSEGALYSDESGVNSFSGDPAETTDLLTKYATSLDWTDDTRTAIKYTEATAEEDEDADETEETEETEEETTLEYANDYTTSALNEVKMFEDDTYFYITMCTNIYDINTSTSEEEDEDGNNSVRYEVIADLKEEKAEDDIAAEVSANSTRFAIKNIRDKVVSEIVTSFFDSNNE